MERIKLGWAKREVSINGRVPLAGQFHLRVSKGIADPLYVTALAVDGGEGQDCILMISCDIVVLRHGIINEVIDMVREKHPEIPADCIVMNASHTHTAGFLNPTRTEDLEGNPLHPWQEYHAFYARQAAAAACEAWENRKEGGIGYGYSYAVVSHCRRPVYFNDQSIGHPHTSNGHAIMYGNTNKDDFSHYEAGADHYVNVMITYDENNAITGFVINVPCPSQVSEQGEEFSADYWHDVREAVKKEFGENVFVLPQCAAAGDLSPRTLHYKKAQARRMALKYDLPYDPDHSERLTQNWKNKTTSERYDICDRILFAVKDIASWASKDIQTEVKVDHVMEVVPLKRRMITQAEKERSENILATLELKIPEDASEVDKRVLTTRYQTALNRNKNAIRRFETQDPNNFLPMRMHVFRIGDVAMATNRFELYQDFMHRMQARSPFLQTFIIQLAGEEEGTYLPTERAQNNRGYGSAYYDNQVGYEGGQQIVEATVRILKDLKAKDEE